MNTDDFTQYLTDVPLDVDMLALLDAVSADRLHGRTDRTRLWRVIASAARETPLAYGDARWLARAADWTDTPLVDDVNAFVRQRDADARDRAWQTRVDPLPDHLARPRHDPRVTS